MYVIKENYHLANSKHIVVRDKDYIGDLKMHLKLSDERMKILCDWAQVQVDIINEKDLNHFTGAFFTYMLTPTNIGSELTVFCRVTGNELDLSLIGDEMW
jgi:hypothetical protein